MFYELLLLHCRDAPSVIKAFSVADDNSYGNYIAHVAISTDHRYVNCAVMHVNVFKRYVY